MPRETNIQIRRGAASDWSSVNPTLAQGEIAMETDTKKLKVGDGSTSWNSLQYVRADGGDLDEGAGTTTTAAPGSTTTAAPTTTTAAPGDPYFGNVSLLLHMEGTDYSFTDSSSNNRTITLYGDDGSSFGTLWVTQTSEQSKFGAKSMKRQLLLGTHPRVSQGQIVFDSNDFVIECWIRPNSTQTSLASICGNKPSPNQSGDDWVLYYYDNKLRFHVANYSSFSYNGYQDETPLLASQNSIAPETWTHIAIARNGSQWKMWVNGSLESSQTWSGSLDGGSSRIFGFGGNGSSYGSYAGFIDELRVTIGTDRGYVGSGVVVPTDAFYDHGI